MYTRGILYTITMTGKSITVLPYTTNIGNEGYKSILLEGIMDITTTTTTITIATTASTITTNTNTTI